jgi:hypothetical protein
MSPSTDRTHYRELVAQVAAKAKARLPEAVNGRIEAAVKLVLSHDVESQDDGSILVGSSTDALKTYRLVGTSCECQDFTRGQAPGGWCQHRIAAGLHKRVGELLAAPVPVDPETVPEPWPDNDPEEPAAPPPVPAPAPLPEAPCSVNCHITVAGRQVQVTLRGHDEQGVLTRLEAVFQRYPMPLPTPQASSQGQPLTPQQHNAAAMHKQVSGFCPVHSVQMKENHKDGWQWYSHLHEGTWCKGR